MKTFVPMRLTALRRLELGSMIQDKTLLHILAKLERYGHEKAQLQIAKEKQSYIVGHKRQVPYYDGREGYREIFSPDCKITYVKKTDKWKLYWMRADMKWHLPKKCFWICA